MKHEKDVIKICKIFPNLLRFEKVRSNFQVSTEILWNFLKYISLIFPPSSKILQVSNHRLFINT